MKRSILVREFVRLIRFGRRRVPQFFRIDRIEIRRIRRVLYFGRVRRRDTSYAFFEVDTGEERVLFDFDGVLAESPVRARAQFQYQIDTFSGDVRVRWYFERTFPVYHLKIYIKKTRLVRFPDRTIDPARE